jgi:hypothetical protein
VNFSIEEVNIRSTFDESNLDNLHKKDLTLSLVDHEIVTKNGDGTLTKHQNSVLMKLNKIDSSSPVIFQFLIKFNDSGTFSIKFDADYKILKREIYDDTSSMRYSGQISIDVKAPFNIKHE